MSVVRLGNPSGDGRRKQSLEFTFPTTWMCLNFDETRTDRPHPNPDRAKLGNWRFRAIWKDPVTRALTVAAAPTGLKAVDIVTFDPEAKILYLIEGTDYRAADAAPLPESLPDEAAAKFRDTLAALAIGQVPAPRSYAALTGALAVARDVVCVLHIEFPVDPLLGRADLSDVFDRVRAIMKHSGLRTEVFTGNEAEGWTVRSVDH